jgi:TPR repeat protein
MKASVNSIPEADLNIAFLHHYGLGTSVNLDKSFEYFTKAAKHNFPQAQYHLGLLYKNGQSVAKDLDQANYWFEKAAVQNLDEAKLMTAALALREPNDVDLYIVD